MGWGVGRMGEWKGRGTCWAVSKAGMVVTCGSSFVDVLFPFLASIHLRGSIQIDIF